MERYSVIVTKTNGEIELACFSGPNGLDASFHYFDNCKVMGDTLTIALVNPDMNCAEPMRVYKSKAFKKAIKMIQ